MPLKTMSEFLNENDAVYDDENSPSFQRSQINKSLAYHLGKEHWESSAFIVGAVKGEEASPEDVEDQDHDELKADIEAALEEKEAEGVGEVYHDIKREGHIKTKSDDEEKSEDE